MQGLRETDVVSGERPPNFICVADKSKREQPPHSRIIETGVVVGDGEEGDSRCSIIDSALENVAVKASCCVAKCWNLLEEILLEKKN